MIPAQKFSTPPTGVFPSSGAVTKIVFSHLKRGELGTIESNIGAFRKCDPVPW